MLGHLNLAVFGQLGEQFEQTLRFFTCLPFGREDVIELRLPISRAVSGRRINHGSRWISGNLGCLVGSLPPRRGRDRPFVCVQRPTRSMSDPAPPTPPPPS